jgi:hypothetical protein
VLKNPENYPGLHGAQVLRVRRFCGDLSAFLLRRGSIPRRNLNPAQFKRADQDREYHNQQKRAGETISPKSARVVILHCVTFALRLFVNTNTYL